MAYEDVARGVGTGATAGAAAGSIIPGVGTAAGTVAGGILGGAAGGLFGGNNETPMQQRQRELIDQLLESLRGNGAYSDLFNVDEESFQKSFVDPMKKKFSSQIAPQIQQSYIASGQHRGTGLDDTLTRAGVDMDQLLNQYYYQAQQDAMNRKTNVMGSVLGAPAGAQQKPTWGQAAMQGVGGYMTSDSFGKDIGNLISSIASKRKGFENDESTQPTT